MKDVKLERAVLEKDFLAQVLELAERLGWLSCHFRPAQTSREYLNKFGARKKVWVTAVQGDGKGFPDLVLVKVFPSPYPGHAATGRTIFVEVKRVGEKPDADQVKWLDLLSMAGNEVYLFTISSWDEIVYILTLGHTPNLIEKAELKTAWPIH